MKQVCKCHGVSGSCSVKVCWKVMPEIRVVSDELAKRYEAASRINEKRSTRRVIKLKMIVMKRFAKRYATTASTKERMKEYKDDLIFVDRSPNFCKRNSAIGSTGTSQRVCKIETADNSLSELDKIKQSKSDAIDLLENFDIYQSEKLNKQHQISQKQQFNESCDYLCCGRGYYSKLVEIVEDCDCQFQWCCYVKCKKCRKQIKEYYCN